jgi:hypothetical protein
MTIRCAVLIILSQPCVNHGVAVVYFGFPSDHTCYRNCDCNVYHAVLISNYISFVVIEAQCVMSSSYCCSTFYKIFPD